MGELQGTDAGGTPVRYPNFDLLRLLLAIEVMIGHYTHRDGLLQWQDRIYRIHAVPAFVAISGFLILQSYEHTPSWFRFAWKRFCRVAPAFLASLLLVYLAAPHLISQTLLCYVSAGMIQPYSGGNPPVWSLMVEEVLYAALAIGVSIGMYRAKWPLLVWVIVAIYLTPLLNRYALDASRIGYPVAAFPVGSAMYIYREELKRIPSWTWLALFLWCVFAPRGGGDLSVMFLSILGSVAVVGLGAWGPKLPQPKWDLSYGIYIYHWPLLLYLDRRDLEMYTMLFIPVIVSMLSWLLIERPALGLKNLSWKRFSRNREDAGMAIQTGKI